MAIRNQQALYNLINEKLNDNSYGVAFRTDLYNAGTNRYYTIDEIGQKSRFVPVMISDVVGEYLNIPNANSTNNEVGISFDIFVDKKGNFIDKEETEFENVGYTDTLNAIEEFKNSLLAQYFPLGTPYLFMGGEDSDLSLTVGTTFGVSYIKIIFKPKNNDDENILNLNTQTYYTLEKDDTYINFNLDASRTISVPYTVDEYNTIEIKREGTDWTITNGEYSDSTPIIGSIPNETSITVGKTTGIECILQSLQVSSSSAHEQILIDTWNDKSEITNSGDSTIFTSEINNCILWSEDGNAIFGFGTLNPVSNIRTIDGGYYYQEFELESTVFISNDVLFGNNFEYFLKYEDESRFEQIYPVDRQHTLATELGSNQNINANKNEHIVEESSREHTLSFYYIPTKRLTNMLKHIVDPSIAQNTGYTLKVQYPFFNIEYDVVLENGGLEPNINTISTFSLTLKRKSTLV